MEEWDEHSGMAVTREVVRRTNPSIPMSMPEGETAWRSFEASWTDHEREADVGEWSRERAGEFIQANAGMIASFFESMEDAASKALVTLAFRLHELGLDRLDYQARLRGSKFGVEHEDFAGSLALAPSSTAIDRSEASSGSRSAELAHLEPGAELDDMPKIAPVWSDREGCLLLWDQVRSALGDQKGSSSAQDAALLLVHFEYISQKNADKVDSRLEGLSRDASDGSVHDAGKDAVSSTSRVEARISSAPSTRTKM